MEVVIILFMFWLFTIGISYESEFLVDTTGFFFILLSLIGISWNLYDMWILFKFRNTDGARKIHIDKKDIKVMSQGSVDQFNTKQLIKVIYSTGLPNWRSTTSDLSYSELIFKNGKRLTITSLLLKPQKIKELLKDVNYHEVNRDRKLFEVIKNNNH